VKGEQVEDGVYVGWVHLSHGVRGRSTGRMGCVTTVNRRSEWARQRYILCVQYTCAQGVPRQRPPRHVLLGGSKVGRTAGRSSVERSHMCQYRGCWYCGCTP
jgi:hypothetical protein